MAIIKGGIPITTLEEWERRAGPKRANQWREGRSALETARAWLTAGDRFPAEVLKAFQQHPEFGEIRSWHAEPEVRLPFDSFGGETRNSDLVVSAIDDHGEFLVAVESKADEEFSETTADILAAAVDRWLANPRSNGILRVQQLASAVLGPLRKYETPLKEIRYQLLTATAGAIREAERRELDRAVLLIQEFITDETEDKKHLANETDLDTFVHRASHGMYDTVPSGGIIGPIQLPGQPLFKQNVRFYLGKVSRNIRTH